MRIHNRWLWLVLAICILTGLCMAAYWYAEDILSPPLNESNLKGTPLDLVTPGTILTDKIPEGWSHLIIKSTPKLSSGAVDKLFDLEKDYVSLFFLLTYALVENKGTRIRPNYSLEKVGLGVATNIKGKEMILTPESLGELKVNLSLPARLVLRGMCNKQKEARYIVHGSNFVIYDTPSLIRRPRGNREAILRYALLVDRKTGKLDTVVWGIDLESGGRTPFGPMELLAPGTDQIAPVFVDPAEFGPLGRPGPNAFGAERLPKGEKELEIPPEMLPLMGNEQFTVQEANRLRDLLQDLLYKTHSSRMK